MRTKTAAIWGTIVSLFFITVVAAQDLSNKGKDFWVVYAGHIDGTNSRMALYITSDQNATGTVTINGSTIPFTVLANQVFPVQLTNSSTPSNALALNSQTEGIGLKKGIHILSDKPVAVYAHILNAARSGSTLVLPTNVLGKEYYVSSYKSTSSSAPNSIRRSQFDIIGTTDNTTIQITPTQADANNTHPANVPFTITLSKGDVYQYQSEEDLTGTHIKSIGTSGATCQPIAVFSGSTFTSMGCTNAGSGDNLYQQLFPFTAWGKTYYTAPFISRAYDIFRILVQDPAEPVYVNGTMLSPATLQVGRFYEFNTQGNNTPRVITSNKPICVLQYLITQGCDNSAVSDPEMVILNPVEQTLNDITVMSARKDLTPPNTNIVNHYLNIIYKTASFSSLKIDGTAPTALPKSIPGTAYSYIQQDVTNSTNTNPAHRITSDSGFICIAYGYGNVESYGYNAGANVKDLYQFVSIQNQYAAVDFPATCKGTPLLFRMTFPYQPTQINWVFGSALNAMGFNDTTITAPQPDSTWSVNGRQLYRYKLPRTYVANQTGTFPIKLLVQNPTPDGCSGEQEIDYDLQVYDRPAGNFTVSSSGCLSDPVSFTDAPAPGSRPSLQWYWNFADGTTSSSPNPSHLYAVAGDYAVTYAVISDIGCISDTIAKAVHIANIPVARFGIASTNCVGKAITFTDSSTVVGSTLNKWYWDFGDGSPVMAATSNAPQSHTFAAAGTYVITLKAESVVGCQSPAFSKTLTVSPNPVAAFGFGNACLPAGAMQFTNQSTIPDGTQGTFTYAWNFGDGGTSSSQNPVHNYTTAGPFNAKLTVTSNAGCTHDTTNSVNTIYPQPVAAFTAPAEVCFSKGVDFADQSNAPNSTVSKWQWDFGDGSSSTQQHPSHTYAAAGPYNVSLTVTSAIGCVSTIATKPVLINALPVADLFAATPTCEKRDITFTNSATAASGTVIKWTWDFGDGTSAVKTNNAALTHTYSSAGSYNAVLKVETDKGCTNVVTPKTVVVNPLPQAGFIVPGNCINDPITQFTDTSSIADGTASQFTHQWNFGDKNATVLNPNTATAKDPFHKFTATGDYAISLVVSSNKGCTDTSTKLFTINGALPKSFFSIQGGNQQCSNKTIRLMDSSYVDIGGLVRLEIYWDYANDPTNKKVVTNPVPGAIYNHTYPEFFSPSTKDYTILVVAYSGDNCLHATTQTLTLKATPELVFTPIPSVCANIPSFQLSQAGVLNNVPAAAVSYTGAGLSATGQFTPQDAGPGTHLLRYTYTASNGCTNYREQTVTVFDVPSADAGPDRFILEGGAELLLGNAKGNNLSYAWSPSTALNTTSILQPIASPTDDITYTLNVTSADGCVAKDQVFVKVLKSPTIPNVFSPNGDGINDLWEIKYLNTYPGATVEVYNRYGQLAFQSKGYSKPWDGTYDGKPLPAGTYYYIVDPKNKRKPVSGFVDLIR